VAQLGELKDVVGGFGEGPEAATNDGAE